MCKWFAATGVFIFAAGMAWAQKSTGSSRQPTPVIPSASQSVPAGGFCRVSILRATPSTVPFTANNPGSTIAGSTVATVAWNITQGSNGKLWTLSAGTLPNTLPGLPVASGNTGNASSHNYTVVLSYQLADSWRYIANTCPLTVTYTVNAN